MQQAAAQLAKVGALGTNLRRVAICPDGAKVYVTNEGSNNVSVIDTALNEVTATLNVGDGPIGVALGKLFLRQKLEMQ